MNKKIFTLAALGVLVSVEIMAHVLPFIEKDFDTFVERIVPLSERKKFKSYHKEIEKRLAVKSEVDQEKLRVSFYENAKKSLKTEHRTWADQIDFFLVDAKYFNKKYDKERSEIRQFLYWYGSYNGFQVATKGTCERDETGFIDNVKNQATKVTQKVKIEATKLAEKISGWFQAMKTRFT